MGSLSGKVAIVTGGGTGLGAAVVLGLARRGANILVNFASSEAEASEVVSSCRAEGVDAFSMRGDVAQDADCRALAEAVLARWSRIDILVNAAGVTKFVKGPDLEGLCADDFAWIYGINVIGAFQMTRAVAPAMRDAGHGAVVNISSIASLDGSGSSLAYSASKGALNTLTAGLARALAPEISVNAILPGFIASKWFTKQLGEAVTQQLIESQEKTTPLRRAGTPEDIAKAVLFLADEGAEHMTGTTLVSDAGQHLL